MTYNPKIPYNDLPLVPPKGNFETVAILKKTIETRAALAELKGRMSVIPNPNMLINTIVLQEAKASSEIENIITTNDILYQAFSSSSTSFDAATKEVLRYREALWSGFNFLKHGNIFTLGMVIGIFQTIIQTNENIRISNPPKRTVIMNRTTGEIIYTPPEGKEILKEKLNNLISFINTDDSIDPLVKLSIAHYQFEAIHPFSDGNGRSGRIINSLFPVKYNLLELPVLYLSKYIIDNKPEYYNRLRNVTENNQWEDWIVFILNAIKETSIYTLEKINSIKKLLDDTITKIKNGHSKIYSKELVELLFHQPYCKIDFLVQNNIVARNAAGRYLNELAQAGILSEKKVGKEILYLNTSLFDLLSS